MKKTETVFLRVKTSLTFWRVKALNSAKTKHSYKLRQGKRVEETLYKKVWKGGRPGTPWSTKKNTQQFSMTKYSCNDQGAMCGQLPGSQDLHPIRSAGPGEGGQMSGSLEWANKSNNWLNFYCTYSRKTQSSSCSLQEMELLEMVVFGRFILWTDVLPYLVSAGAF